MSKIWMGGSLYFSMTGWIGYLKPDQFLDHLTVIKRVCIVSAEPDTLFLKKPVCPIHMGRHQLKVFHPPALTKGTFISLLFAFKFQVKGFHVKDDFSPEVLTRHNIKYLASNILCVQIEI